MTTAGNQKLIEVGGVFATAVAADGVRYWLTKRAIKRVFDRDLTWWEVIMFAAFVRCAGGWLEQGRHQTAELQDRITALRLGPS